MGYTGAAQLPEGLAIVEMWLSTTWTQIWLVVVSTVAIFAGVITYTRIAGLRSFSKMSAFDFASTVAVGSIMAAVAVTEASLLNGLIGLGALYAAQSVVALVRRRTRLERLVDNDPVVLMVGRTVLEDNLRDAQMTARDIRAKLRAANVTDLEDLLGVVLETTGDISVLRGSGPIDPHLLDGVKDADRLLRGGPAGGS
ncbi:MAG TPA: YetF domain-containing protein [Egibacteraceae bacterium]|nr:YetF domain-containing protein [Egibacteraceae bacterium]